MNSQERIAKALAVASDTNVFEMGKGDYIKAREVFKRCFPGRKAVILSATHTWAIIGEKVYDSFKESGIPTEKYIIGRKDYNPSWKYVEMTDCIVEGDFEKALNIENDDCHVESDPENSFKEPSGEYSILVAVGAGVINDLCKLSSHHHGQSYMTIPTAASGDGYSSFGASITYNGIKQTFPCPAPLAIIADLDVLSTAPKHMTAAGYADLAAKIPAGGEWIIADFSGAAPIIPDAWHILQDHIDSYLSSPEDIAAGDPKAIGDLFEGLALSGFAMQAAKSSRPASCSEHMFSHILDMTGHTFNGRPQSHGFQVAIGTLIMCALFDEIFKLDLTKTDADSCAEQWPKLEQEQQRALELFKDFPAPMLGYNEIAEKYEDAGKVRNEMERLKSEWPELREKLESQLYSFEKMKRLFQAVGAPYEPEQIGVSKESIRNMLPKMQMMRSRFNLLDFAKRGQFYDRITSAIFSKGGALEIR